LLVAVAGTMMHQQPPPHPQHMAQMPPMMIPGGAPCSNVPSCGDTNTRLYIGNLDPKVTEALLLEIFSAVGPIQGCKVIKEKGTDKASYGFVDYIDHSIAAAALSSLNGRKIYDFEIKVNWAYAGTKEDTSNHFHIFVGDLSPDIDDQALHNAFATFGSITDARVMWDQNTGRSRGYGFVAFRDKKDAERALNEMNGEWLGNRAIRVNWANQKQTDGVGGSGTDYNSVYNSSSPNNKTVYVGNLSVDFAEHQLRQMFQEYGAVEEVRHQKEKGFAFVRLSTHDQATRSIIGINGMNIGGRVIKASWGKERSNQGPQVTAVPIAIAGMPGGVPAVPAVPGIPGHYGGAPAPAYSYAYPVAAAPGPPYNPMYSAGYAQPAAPPAYYPSQPGSYPAYGYPAPPSYSQYQNYQSPHSQAP